MYDNCDPENLVQQECYLFKMNYLICSKPGFDPIVISHGTILMGDQENSVCIKVETQQMFHIAFFFVFRLMLNERSLNFLSVSVISKCTVVLP